MFHKFFVSCVPVTAAGIHGPAPMLPAIFWFPQHPHMIMMMDHSCTIIQATPSTFDTCLLLLVCQRSCLLDELGCGQRDHARKSYEGRYCI